MNEVKTTATPSDPWHTSGLLNDSALGAHDSIDSLADRAAPPMRQLGNSVAAADDALQAKTHQLKEIRDEWVEGVRSTVRGSPVASVVAAFALGAVIARITR